MFDNELEFRHEDFAKEASPNTDGLDIYPSGLSSTEIFNLAVRVPPKQDDLTTPDYDCDRSFSTPAHLSGLAANELLNSHMDTVATDGSFESNDEHLRLYLDFSMVAPDSSIR